MNKFPSLLAIVLASTSVVSMEGAEQVKFPAKAEKVIVPMIVFRDAKIAECVEFLNKKSKELMSDKVGVPIVLGGPKDEVTEIRLAVQNIPLSEAIKLVAKAGDLEIRVEGETIHLKTKLKEPRLYPKAPPAPTIPGLDPVSK